MKIKTSELTGLALRWAAAHAEYQDGRWFGILHGHSIGVETSPGSGLQFIWRPDEDWLQGGPIIEREHICLMPPTTYKLGSGDKLPVEYWRAMKQVDDTVHHGHGPIPLIAAMRCFVAYKQRRRGTPADYVDVPEELCS